MPGIVHTGRVAHEEPDADLAAVDAAVDRLRPQVELPGAVEDDVVEASRDRRREPLVGLELRVRLASTAARARLLSGEADARVAGGMPLRSAISSWRPRVQAGVLLRLDVGGVVVERVLRVAAAVRARRGLGEHQVGRAGVRPEPVCGPSSARPSTARACRGSVVAGDRLAAAEAARRVGEPEGPWGRVGAAGIGAPARAAGTCSGRRWGWRALPWSSW